MARESKIGWDAEALNKAYRQGLMAATMGMARDRCPYQGEVVVAAWEAGWEDAGLGAAGGQCRCDDLLSRMA